MTTFSFSTMAAPKNYIHSIVHDNFGATMNFVWASFDELKKVRQPTTSLLAQLVWFSHQFAGRKSEKLAYLWQQRNTFGQ